uniref:Uncharacterized protein n=1 Tax=Oryza glumipatula TaxID=40148 RepID=A0A0E0BG91_9ORYZ
MVSSGGGGGARHGVVAAWASFFSSRIGLDCQLHTAVMLAICDPETGECPVRYDVQAMDLPVLEDKEAVSLGKIEVVNIPVEIGTAPSAKQ